MSLLYKSLSNSHHTDHDVTWQEVANQGRGRRQVDDGLGLDVQLS